MDESRDARLAALRGAEERSALDKVIAAADKNRAYRTAIDDIQFVIDDDPTATAKAIRIILKHHGITA